jgi:V8-like Glu-specific endopeptidase
MPPTRLRLACVACLSAAATLVGASDALGNPLPRHAGHAARTVAQVERYWTPDRMENARPADLAVAAGAAGARAAVARQSGSTVPFRSYEVTDTRSYPNRVHGKVFFTRPGAGNFVCSGTVVDASNQATVLTAGHCVHDAGLWSTNFAFAPGYGNVAGTGSAPYGVWAASGEAAPVPWVDSRNVKFDVGAAVIARDTLGRPLESIVGARSVAFNQTSSQTFRSFGYPAVPTADHHFDGTRLWACDSNPPITDDSVTGPGDSTMGIGCDMSGGASGGGWVTASGAVNGINSYRYPNRPDLMFGPYFGSTIEELYDFAAAQQPGVPGSWAVGNAPAPASAAGTLRVAAACKKAKKRKRKLTRRARRCNRHRRDRRG